jgi:succinate dehydrogenase hydrophobic anchor subunit
MSRSLGDMENHAFFVLFVGFVLIVFWHAIWELLTELTDTIYKRHGVAKWKVYVGSLIFVILFIGVYPEILDKI